MILTLRDERILIEIQSYGLLTTRMIAARHFENTAMTTVLRRLRLLEQEGYIHRVVGLEGGQLAWSLTQKSALRFDSKPSKIHFPRFVLDHDLKLVQLRLRLEGANLVHSWRPEHEIRAKVAARFGVRGISHRTIPDGLMGIENKGFKQTLAIEVELSAKNQKRYRSIFWDYGRKAQEQNLEEHKGSGSFKGRIIGLDTFETFATHYNRFLREDATVPERKQAIQKFIRKVEVTTDSVRLHYIVDEDHYERELASDQAGSHPSRVTSHQILKILVRIL